MTHRFFILVFAIFSISVKAQEKETTVRPPEISDFYGTLQFLSSEWMEGRETGEKGSLLAADYIISLMQFTGLKPAIELEIPAIKQMKQAEFSRDFIILKYKIKQSSILMINYKDKRMTEKKFTHRNDYQLITGPQAIDFNACPVFAGYGISTANYDDYKGIDARNKIVMVLDGFPGWKDNRSKGWKMFNTEHSNIETALEMKSSVAKQKGALALIVLSSKIDTTNWSKEVQSDSVYSHPDDEYPDDYYILPADTTQTKVQTVLMNYQSSHVLLSELNLDLQAFEKKASRLLPSSFNPDDKSFHFSVKVDKKNIAATNLIGYIKGKDTTKHIIVGAHYDHLGMRGNSVFYGADDNASGVAGMLALAKVWKESGIQPPCNLIFAAWTAEEKGLLGSRYFTQQIQQSGKRVLLYINMDMISGSETSDSAKNMLSIGTRTSDSCLREIAIRSNYKINDYFRLDLWDVTGHTGSDYASFTEINVPVMTYNSGLHDYYHSPGDNITRTDPVKMNKILIHVNNCLLEYLKLYENISN